MRERLRDVRKALLYRGMLRNPAVSSILSLDPYFPTAAMERYRHGQKVSWLPDPANPITNFPSDGHGLAALVPSDRTLFLLFGELTARKGVLQVLAALRILTADVAKQAAIMIAGRIDAGIAATVRHAAAEIGRIQPELWFHLEDRYLITEELAALVRRCDVVLVPYQRFVGSSGVLTWAAQVNRPVICQDYGLLGRLVRDHGLGMAVDTTDPESLADAIESAIAKGPRSLGAPERMRAFSAAAGPARFAASVLRQAMPSSQSLDRAAIGESASAP